ncbi:MAG: tRNA (N6-isopentenyl adenosine(37)-C2)-methylthiotransferase MiaB [Deltaproteobacteria bacterium]|nr:tRNA (N6-isopentenyl adenosine(37)-C2)-methylthiotransferase MiaB [Deltaproteobacteria bacterium]
MENPGKKAVYIKTFGCQMNERDSQAMENRLLREGYAVAVRQEDADLILFNTCTIRDKAYQKAMSDIGRSAVHKKTRGAKIGICGCVATQSKDALLTRFRHVDFVLGPDHIAELPMIVAEASAGSRSAQADHVDDPGKYVFIDGASKESIATASAFVTIMKGCNYACSYCIVPSVRGKEVCRPADDILAEVKQLVERGVKEVTLLGQNVADYKALPEMSEGQPRMKLGWLVRYLSSRSSIHRLRFTSPHPRDIDDDLIAAYRDETVLCDHIHLPVQSGSNRVLKAMRRRYTRERYLDLVDKLRTARPGIAITTDMIVGFPTETEAEFEESMDLIERVQFDQIYAFAYSPRPGTHAATIFADDVPVTDKQRRLSALFDLERTCARQKNEACVGETKHVLVTSIDPKKPGYYTGRSSDNRIVNFPSEINCIGNIVPVHITKARGHSLTGEWKP